MGRHANVRFLLLALCSGVPARARDHGSDGSQPQREVTQPQRAARVKLATAMTTSPSGPTVRSLGAASRLAGEYRFASGLGVSLEGGASAVSLDLEGQGSRSGTFPGNLLLGLSFERWLQPRLQVAASFRAGAPLALYPGGIDDNRLAELAYAMAASAGGFREPYLWQANVVPLVAAARASFHPLDWLTLSGQLAPAHLLSVNQRPSRWASATQLDAAASFQPFVAHLGLSHFANTLPLENRDRDQAALRFGAGALVYGQRLMLDAAIGLDGPYGALQSAPHPWWGIGISADMSFGAELPPDETRTAP